MPSPSSFHNRAWILLQIVCSKNSISLLCCTQHCTFTTFFFIGKKRKSFYRFLRYNYFLIRKSSSHSLNKFIFYIQTSKKKIVKNLESSRKSPCSLLAGILKVFATIIFLGWFFIFLALSYSPEIFWLLIQILNMSNVGYCLDDSQGELGAPLKLSTKTVSRDIGWMTSPNFFKCKVANNFCRADFPHKKSISSVSCVFPGTYGKHGKLEW